MENHAREKNLLCLGNGKKESVARTEGMWGVCK